MVTNSKNLSLDTAVISTTGLDAEIYASFELDRYLGDALQLPYSFNDLKIKSNELCVADNINAVLYKLHYNFLYINAQTKLSNNDFPTNYRGWVSSTSAAGSSGLAWHHSGSATAVMMNELSAPNDGTNTTILSGIVAGAVVESIDSNQWYVGFVATSATLMAFKSDIGDVDAFKTLHKGTIEDATALTFTNIRDMAINSENRLLVIDDTNIHKFNVDAALTSNRAISGIGRFLITTMGGKSKNIFDKDKFKNPVSLSLGTDDSVYVLDNEDQGYKVYDKDLNWISTHPHRTDFTKLSGGHVVSIAVDPEDDNVYVLASNGILFRYGADGNRADMLKLDDPVQSGETYRQIYFSRKNRDIVYVVTSKSLFKKFKSKISKSIGAFRLAENLITDQTLEFVSVMITDNTDFDYLFLGSNSLHSGDDADGNPVTVNGQVGKMFKFNEKVNYKTLVNDEYKQNLYSLSAINIDSGEFVTSWCINKSFHKILHNHLVFRDNMLFKFQGAYDEVGRIKFTKSRHVVQSDMNLFEYAPTFNNFIGINEPVFAEVINRPIKEMYDLQVSLLGMCEETISNKFPYPSQVVELK